MRLWVLLLGALGVSGCLVPIAETREESSKVGSGGSNVAAGGGAGITNPGWDAGAEGGTAGTADSGTKPEADAGNDSGNDAASVIDCAGLAQFVDDFEDDTPAPFWLPGAEGGAVWEETDGVLEVWLPNSVTSGTFGGYRLEKSFDLAGCSVSVRVTQVPLNGAFVYAHLWLTYGATGYAELVSAGEGIQFRYWQLGMLHVLGIKAYNAVQHAFWRLRHDGVNLIWETSPNGNQWTLEAATALPSVFAALRIGAGGSGTKVLQSVNTASFDSFDVSP